MKKSKSIDRSVVQKKSHSTRDTKREVQSGKRRMQEKEKKEERNDVCKDMKRVQAEEEEDEVTMDKRDDVTKGEGGEPAPPVPDDKPVPEPAAGESDGIPVPEAAAPTDSEIPEFPSGDKRVVTAEEGEEEGVGEEEEEEEIGDVTLIPVELDARFEGMAEGEEDGVHPTIINPGNTWTKKYQRDLLCPLVCNFCNPYPLPPFPSPSSLPFPFPLCPSLTLLRLKIPSP
jgi:hypothetical protein